MSRKYVIDGLELDENELVFTIGFRKDGYDFPLAFNRLFFRKIYTSRYEAERDAEQYMQLFVLQPRTFVVVFDHKVSDLAECVSIKRRSA